MDASFFSKPLSQLEYRDNKKSCHLLEKKGTHPMRMHDNNTTCNRSNQNTRLPDTHSRSTNQHPATPDTTKTTCYRSAAQCWKAFLVILSQFIELGDEFWKKNLEYESERNEILKGKKATNVNVNKFLLYPTHCITRVSCFKYTYSVDRKTIISRLYVQGTHFTVLF